MPKYTNREADQHGFEQLTPATRALVYYALKSLKNDVERNIHQNTLYPQVSNLDILHFYQNTVQGIEINMLQLEELAPRFGYSLIEHFTN